MRYAGKELKRNIMAETGSVLDIQLSGSALA
jgi:hypothetical protein